MHPQVSFTTNGGYVVWQDYFADGNELGIGAMRLKNDLTGSGVSFRVNSQVVHDQENGQVSTLNDGGAVFAWQGGQMGRQHIYARFLSSSNNWTTGDVQVNSATNRFQANPVITTLASGNVVVVYESRNQAGPGSMSDIYLQMLAPNGNKVGGEILVNQFTVNNQRSPAITALQNGNFAVAWVSEQERWTDASNGLPSVDIYARVFDASGSAVSGEFLVNGDSKICATPDITSAPDNGVMVTWIEKDLAVRNNGWDIFARRFTSTGVGVSSLPVSVNTQLYGDQYSPKIRRIGATYLDIWTSLGQDGSYEGVYGRYLADDGSVSGNEFQVNTSTLGSQMHQVLGTDGAGRLLAVWTGFGVGVNGFDLYGQKFANPSLVVIGTNNTAFNTDPNANPNSVTDGQTGGGYGGCGGATGTGTNVTCTETNSFTYVKGTYNCLVYDSAAPKSANSGYITITTTAKKNTGSFTAKLQLGLTKYSFSGVFDASGAYSARVGALNINLLLDLHGSDVVTGQISSGNWTAQVQANRAVFSKTHPASLAGNYTMIVQPGDSTTGTGVGTVTVDASGNVSCSLTLPDGTKVSQSTTLSKTGSWPLYSAPYKTGGMVVGWLQFAGTRADGFDGQCVWTKPAGAGTPYSGGLTNGVTVSGSLYQAPPSFRAFGNSKVILNGGGLTAPLTNGVTWGVDNKILSDKNTTSLKLSLTTASGLFKGTVTDPASGHVVSFQGVLFEKNNVGLGFFLGPNQSGAVSFVPNP